MTTTLERVELDYFERAEFCFVSTQEVQAAPERIFEVFLDADSWTKWVPVIKRVEWTSPFPIEVGSTRTVTMTSGFQGHEEFIAFDPGERMAFRFNETSRPALDAFAEDYLVTDLGNGRSRIVWKMAMTPQSRARPSLKIFAPAIRFGLATTLRKFARYVESNPVLPERS